VTLDVLASEDAPPRGLVDTSLQATRGVVTQVQFLGSGTVAFSTDRGRVSFRSAFNLARQVSVQEPQCPAEADGKRAQMPHFTVSRNQLELVTFGCFAGLRRWSFANSAEWAFRDHARLVLYGGGIGRDIEGAAFGRDGRTMVTKTEDGGLTALDRETGSALSRVPAAASAAPLLGASRIVGTTVESERLGTAEASRGTHSPSGRLVVSCCRNPAAVWDAAQGRRLITMRRGSAVVQFAPDEHDLIAFVEPRVFGAPRSYAVYSLDPAWYFRRACLMLSDAARRRRSGAAGSNRASRGRRNHPTRVAHVSRFPVNFRATSSTRLAGRSGTDGRYSEEHTHSAIRLRPVEEGAREDSRQHVRNRARWRSPVAGR
jgi:hypothetical protein